MKLTKEHIITIKKLLEREQQSLKEKRPSAASLSKKERVQVGKILEALPGSPEATEKEYPFNRLSKSVIEKIVSARLKLLVEVFMPEYEKRQKRGENNQGYMNKNEALKALFKEIIELCQA